MPQHFKLTALATAVSLLTAPAHAQQNDEAPMETIQVSGSWLGSGLQNSVKNFAGARTVIDKESIDASGAANIGDVLRRP